MKKFSIVVAQVISHTVEFDAESFEEACDLAPKIITYDVSTIVHNHKMEYSKWYVRLVGSKEIT